MRLNHACLPLVLAALVVLDGCALDPAVTQVLVAAGTAAATGGAPVPVKPGTTTPAPVPVVPVGGSVGSPAGATTQEQVLDLVNRYRKVAGVPPVAYDAAVTKACQSHAEYLVKNKGNSALDGFGAHKEDPKLPGATPEWANLNRGNDVAFIDPLGSVDGWVNSLYHRTQMLEANLTHIGFGAAGGGDNAADVLAFVASDGSSGEVSFPGNGQTEVPLTFSGEFPNPVPDNAPPAGYPVTLQLPGSVAMTGFSGRLTDDAGQDVPCYYSDKEHQASPLYDQGNVACLFAKRSLKPGKTYKAHFEGSVDGKPRAWDWSFTTVAIPPAIAATDKAALTRALGKFAAVEGVVANAGTLEDGTVFLNWTDDLDPSAFVPPDVWKQTGLKAEALIGKRVRLLCTPRKPNSFELDIQEPDWITVL